MRFTAVLDSDGLIKLGKAGILGVVVDAWNCLIPQAVYTETVEQGIQASYPDAPVIRDALRPSMVRSRVRHPRATALLKLKRGLGIGEQEALHLFFATKANAIVTDDAAFVALLEQAGLRYLPPALVLVQMAQQGHLEGQRALEALEHIAPHIRPEVYQAARADLHVLLVIKTERAQGGEAP